MIEHMVWIKFNEDVSATRIDEHLTGLRALKEQVPEVVEIAVGENFTDRSGGFTHGLLVRLPSRPALQAYLDHPEHVRVASSLKEDAELRAMDIEG